MQNATGEQGRCWYSRGELDWWLNRIHLWRKMWKMSSTSTKCLQRDWIARISRVNANWQTKNAVSGWGLMFSWRCDVGLSSMTWCRPQRESSPTIVSWLQKPAQKRTSTREAEMSMSKIPSRQVLGAAFFARFIHLAHHLPVSLRSDCRARNTRRRLRYRPTSRATKSDKTRCLSTFSPSRCNSSFLVSIRGRK